MARFHKCPRPPPASCLSLPSFSRASSRKPLVEVQAQPGCVRLWTPSENALLSPFKSNASRQGTGDPFIDGVRSESEAGEVRHTIRVGSVAFGTHAPSPLCVQDVQAFAQEGALRAAICESGPVMKALGECSAGDESKRRRVGEGAFT